MFWRIRLALFSEIQIIFLYADCSATSALTENYMEINHLKNFVSALYPLIILRHVVMFRMGVLSLGD